MIKKIISYGFVQLLERLISFFLLPLLTKNLSQEEFGIWTQLTISTGVLLPVILLGIPTALIRFLPTINDIPSKRNSIISVSFIITIGIYCLIAITFYSFKNFFSYTIFGPKSQSYYIIPFLIMLLTEILFEIITSILRSDGLINRVSLYILIRGISRISLLTLLLLIFEIEFWITLIFLSIFQLCIILIIFVIEIPLPHLIQTNIINSRHMWLELFRFSIASTLVAIFTVVNNFIDRFFLTHYLDIKKTALYSAAYSLASMIGILYSIIGFSLFPALSSYFAKKNIDEATKIYVNSMKLYVGVAIPCVMALTVCGSNLLLFLTTTQYNTSTLLFFLLTASIAFFGVYQLSIYAIILSGSYLKSVYLIAVSSISCIILNSIFIPILNEAGSALSLFISNCILSAMAYWETRKLLKDTNISMFIFDILIRSTIVVLIPLKLFTNWHHDNSLLLFLAVLSSATIYLLIDYKSRSSVIKIVFEEKFYILER